MSRREIMQTFKELSLNVDLSPLNRLSEIRNSIEHHHLSGTPTRLVQEAIAHSMTIIRAVIVNELGQRPAVLLEQGTWDTILQEASFYDELKKECRSTFARIKWGNQERKEASNILECPECAVALIRNVDDNARHYQELNLACSACGASVDWDETFASALERYLEDTLWFESHMAAREGGDSVVEHCPDCGRETFLTGRRECVYCDFSMKGMSCSICDEPLTVDDYDYDSRGMCSYHQHQFDKDD